ncbi:hypothetical protein HDU76_011055 [Blyttiomyces sp. JEL0837]|nr:hypothetical protein HDU76_011055 [Blyttiomyces sp. JEL0837]
MQEQDCFSDDVSTILMAAEERIDGGMEVDIEPEMIKLLVKQALRLERAVKTNILLSRLNDDMWDDAA